MHQTFTSSAKTFVSTILLVCSLQANSQLAAGDIAIIGVNRLIPVEIAIVALKHIASGTKIYICDFPYSNGTGFVNTSNTSEGAITWTPTSNITRGTVFLITINCSTPTPVVSGLPGTVTVTGWSSGVTASTPIPGGGDNWFIYQGTSPTAPTTFIYGFTNYFTTATGAANGWLANGTQVATNTSTSELPPGLTNGSTARSLAWSTASGGSHGDYNVYNGTTSGDAATLRTAIGTVGSWLTNEATGYKLTSASAGTTLDGGAPFFTSFDVLFALPVQLLSFTAKKSLNDVDLQWQIDNAVNLDRFEIEQSFDGFNFTAVQQKRFEPGVTSYAFKHNNGFAGKQYSYYRLKSIDVDGSFSYSKILQVQSDGSGKATFVVKSNPFTNEIQLAINLPAKQTVFVRLISMTGKLLASKQTNAEEGFSTITLKDLEPLSNGVYLLQLEAGNEKFVHKLVKQ